MAKRRLNPRKLLVASVGVATVSYLGTGAVACSSDSDEAKDGTGNGGQGGETVANLVAPPPEPTVANLVAPPPEPTVANLVAPPPTPTADASIQDGAPDAEGVAIPVPTVANLVAPPPLDGGNSSDQ